MYSSEDSDRESLSDGEVHENVNWEDWQADNEEEEDDQKTRCLFSGARFSTPAEALQHATTEFGFHFCAIRKARKLDFYDAIKAINFIRSTVAAHKCIFCGKEFDNNEQLLEHMKAEQHFQLPEYNKWSGEEHLTPVLQDDCLLFGFEEEDEMETELADAPGLIAEDLPRELELPMQLAHLQAQHAVLVNEVQAAAGKPMDATKVTQVQAHMSEMLQLLGQMSALSFVELGSEPIDAISNKGPRSLPASKARIGRNGQKSELMQEVDDTYFDSYSRFSIHREMISDTVRTDAYRDALEKNPDLVGGKVIMDVGCGTGILSMFAARAGAEKVIAVDGSTFIAEIARKNVIVNGFEDKVTIVQGKLEDIQLPVQKVDVIVSEWMGYALLYESMLDTVLHARDKYLAPGGCLLPDTATIFMAGVSKGATSMPFWEDVYGFDMKHIGQSVHEDALKAAVVTTIEGEHVITNKVIMQDFDLMTMVQADVNFTSSFTLELPSPAGDEVEVTWCYGLVLWFDVGFTTRVCKASPVVMSTSPHTKTTHWVQTLLHLRNPIALTHKSMGISEMPIGSLQNAATQITGKITFGQGPRQRNLDITLEYCGMVEGKTGVTEVVMYEL